MFSLLSVLCLLSNLFCNHQVQNPEINEKMKGEWVLTAFFEEVKSKKEFWSINSFPSASHAEINIKDSTMNFLGWYENLHTTFEVSSPNEIKLGSSYNIKYDAGKNRLVVKYFKRGELHWKHYYHKKGRHDMAGDISDLNKFIKENCLIGQYKNLHTGEEVLITHEKVAGNNYQVLTERDHRCGDWNFMKIDTPDGRVLSSWSWYSDTLRINKLIRVKGKEGCKYYKEGKKVEELILSK